MLLEAAFPPFLALPALFCPDFLVLSSISPRSRPAREARSSHEADKAMGKTKPSSNGAGLCVGVCRGKSGAVCGAMRKGRAEAHIVAICHPRSVEFPLPCSKSAELTRGAPGGGFSFAHDVPSETEPAFPPKRCAAPPRRRQSHRDWAQGTLRRGGGEGSLPTVQK